MVILETGDGYQVIANNGFVWIEFANGNEYVFSDEEADEAWAEFERTATHLRYAQYREPDDRTTCP